MNFNLVTIFPEIIKLLDFGVIGKAIEKDLISINGLNPSNTLISIGLPQKLADLSFSATRDQI